MVVLALLAACAGCAGSVEPAWRLVTPAGMSPTSMFAGPAGLFVGGNSVPPDSGPVLVVRDQDSWRGVSVAPTTGYGQVATLDRVAVDPRGRVVALGNATGGAHLNPRRTAWIGDPAGIVEEPQTVDTFGGNEAGGITDVVYGDEPLVVGEWSLAPGVTGIAVWRHHGMTWVRQPSPAVFVGSPPRVAESATAASAAGPETVIVGLETTLAEGGVHQRAVLWRSDGPIWHRTDLDTSDRDSAATDVSCAGSSCLVVGRLGDTLAAWWMTGDSAGALDLPHRAVDHYTAQPKVATDGELTAIAVGDGSGLLTRDGTGPWAASTTPDGEVRSIGVYQGQVVLLLRRSDGAQEVYRR